MRYKLGILILLLLLAVPAVASAAPMDTLVIVNDRPLPPATQLYLEDGRALIPFRIIFEALAASVDWDEKTQIVTATKGTVKIILRIGNISASVNSSIATLDVAPKIIGGSTYVPLRFVSEALGAAVDYSDTMIVIKEKAAAPAADPAPAEPATPAPGGEKSIQDIAKLSASVLLVRTYDASGELLGSGSGFLAGSDGKVVTNYHVIDGAVYVEVVDSESNVYEVAGVTDYDTDRDIAILLVEGLPLTPLALGDSAAVEIGATAVAIGSPRRLQNTVSSGIISGRPDIEAYAYLQTTAPISPGSSGGALLNGRGEVIGVTTGYLADSQNLNLAIPINEVKPFLQKNGLTSVAKIREEMHPQVSYADLSEYLMDNYSVYQNNGFDFYFNHITMVESDTDSDTLYGFILMDRLAFSEVVSEFLDYPLTTRLNVELWMSAVLTEVQERYPDKYILIGITYVDFFETYPDVFPADAVSYNSDTGMWDIDYTFFFVYTDELTGGADYDWKL